MRPVAGVIAGWRERLAKPMGDRESVVVGLLGTAYVAGALAAALLLPHAGIADPLLVGVLLVLFLGVLRVHLEVGSGYVSPAQLVFVPLLFVLPLWLMPLMLPAAFALEELPDIVRGRAHVHRWLNWLADSWFVLGPVSVLGVFAPGPPGLSQAPIYLAALVAQTGLGLGTVVLRAWLVSEVSTRDALRSAGLGYQFNVLLSLPGFAVIYAAIAHGVLWLALLAPLLAVCVVFARAHKQRWDEIVAVHNRSWERFLEDCRRLERVQASSHLTAHWRCAAELALATAAQLTLPLAERAAVAHAARLAATAFLPPPAGDSDGALTDTEREQLRNRTVVAERRLQLAAVLIEGRLFGAGGAVASLDAHALREQAAIVRASAERFDGRGFPDGLGGSEIPLAARIIAPCVAYSAMTSGRHHRAAMSRETALEELRRGAGSQFDPAVIDALVATLTSEPTPAWTPAPLAWLLSWRALGRATRRSFSCPLRG